MRKPTKVLIVDDDLDFIDATRTILINKAYEVDTAYNKNEAIQKIKQNEPDLILLDIMMDRLDDGFTLCYKLKHDPKFKNIPILSLSSVTAETGFKFSPKTDGAHLESDDYLAKPFETKDLLGKIQNLLK